MSKRAFMIKAVIVCTMMVMSAQAGYIWTAPQDGQQKYSELENPVSIPENQQGLHTTPEWQMLGTCWGVDDGVSWSINGGDWVNNIFELNVGDEIQFQFDMYKPLWGTHSYDAIRVWVDDGDGFETIKTYSYDVNPDQLTMDSTWNFNTNGNYIDYDWNDYWKKDTTYENFFDRFFNLNPIITTKQHPDADENWDRYYANEHKFFYSDAIQLTEEGDFELISRVLCSSDIASSNNTSPTHYPTTPEDWSNFNHSNLVGTSSWAQGEREMYSFTVNNVPEPAVLSFLGISLLGLGLLRRKNRKS